ncbi:flavo protein [Viridothelium virens]|uniref:Flavo protein n=1 Tax=Viridothelium virens TaxID=1048519 RepID=A0A6A6H0A4_VIRVR|nr:flavo protein [Viridothelium virens]
MQADHSNPTNNSITPSGPHHDSIPPPTAPSPNPRGTKRTRTSSTSPSPPPPHLPHHTPLSPFQHPPTISSPPFKASDHAQDKKSHLLLACTGSVATIKLPLILQALSAHTSSLSVIVLLTRAATRFLAAQSAEQPHWATLRGFQGVQAVFTDEDEWARPWTRGAPILHVELRRWADLLVVAPLSAAAMGRMVVGIGEDLLGEVVRAWDVDAGIDGPPRKVIVVAPAMNTAMWKHPVTKTQMRVLEWDWGVNRDGWIEVLRPQEKALACGDTGDGAMMEWTKIVKVIEDRMDLRKDRGFEEGAERDAKRARA